MIRNTALYDGKKLGFKNFFKPLGVGDLWVPGVSDFAGEYPLFQGQKSLVQETIEALGHLCLILPKFHCELNFIEFFWGAVKKYLHDNCDYTFDTLKENMPKALESVSVQTIQCWKHCMFQWMEAYCSGLGTTEAQQQAKKFS